MRRLLSLSFDRAAVFVVSKRDFDTFAVSVLVQEDVLRAHVSMQVTSLVDGFQREENFHFSVAELLLGKLIDLLVLEVLVDAAMIEVWSDKVGEIIINHVLFQRDIPVLPKGLHKTLKLHLGELG